jgi:hypothetical protein
MIPYSFTEDQIKKQADTHKWNICYDISNDFHYILAYWIPSYNKSTTLSAHMHFISLTTVHVC